MQVMDKRIMIVDDDPDVLVFLRTIFEQQHFEVLTVDRGSDCIKELERGFKGIVLIDLIMPFMDGWDTVKEIIKKRLNKDIIISIITADRNPNNEKMEEFKPHIHDYIPKPFDLQKLISDVNNITVSKKLLIPKHHKIIRQS